jgi:hypothetical protein
VAKTSGNKGGRIVDGNILLCKITQMRLEASKRYFTIRKIWSLLINKMDAP